MMGRRNTTKLGTGRNRGIWPVLGVLLAAALVPAACVLWFMNAAMRNERLAVRQRLTDVYRQKVQTDQDEIAAFWSLRMRLPRSLQPAELFAAIVRSGICDSVIVRDYLDQPGYPIRRDVVPPQVSNLEVELAQADQQLQLLRRAIQSGEIKNLPAVLQAIDSDPSLRALDTALLNMKARLPAMQRGPRSSKYKEYMDSMENLQKEYDARRKTLLEATVNSIMANAEANKAIILARLPEVRQRFTLAPPDANMPEQWVAGEQLEFEAGQYKQAASSYALAAGNATDANQQARALQAQARCLMRAGDANEALGLLSKIVKSLREARDPFGRLIHLDAAMRLIQPDNPSPQSRQEARQYLLGRLNAYDGVPILSSQRMFLMMELSRQAGVQFPTLAAEALAAEYLDVSQPPAEESRVTPTALPGLWQMASDDGPAVLLFRQDKLVADLQAACKLDEPFAGITTRLELPGSSAAGSRPMRREPGKEPFLTVPASEHLPGWELAVYLNEDPFAASADKAELAYLTVGVSAVAVISLLAAVLASYLGRQMRLTRLKNDLIATVSHELKTPLASMRVLVDTLREGRCADAKQAGEYFELIARENERLSRLIDNFLTFSRMERNKRAFEFASVDVADAVRTAVAAVRERFSPPESRSDVDLPADLPLVRADRDALVTVLLNLLDNAWKYSGDDKAVKVRAFSDGSSVRIEVADNGIGMSRRAQKRIFDKFYQVDQTLSRKAGGCGLGLAIVKFILDAHGGSISVKSLPGKGSTFTVRLPSATREGRLNAEVAENAEKNERRKETRDGWG
jgi:signal transduction histidine kinase